MYRNHSTFYPHLLQKYSEFRCKILSKALFQYVTVQGQKNSSKKKFKRDINPTLVEAAKHDTKSHHAGLPIILLSSYLPEPSQADNI